MSLEVWIAFVLASSAMLAVPGPTVLLVISYVLGQDRSTGWYTVPGVVLGDFVAMTASLLGAGAVLATSSSLFSLLKFAGAIYLIWLGIKLWRADPGLKTLRGSSDQKGNKALFLHSFVVTSLNPKGIVFFVAFVPLFINTGQPVLAQFAVLEATFLALAAVNIILWVLLTGQLRRFLKNARALKMTNRIGASFLMGAGVLTAAIQRNN